MQKLEEEDVEQEEKKREGKEETEEASPLTLNIAHVRVQSCIFEEDETQADPQRPSLRPGLSLERQEGPRDIELHLRR